MKVGGISQPVTRNLVPLSEYKGAILKLTKKDKEQIQKLRDELLRFECEHYDLQKYISSAKYVSENFMQNFYGLEQIIDSIKAQIKAVKMNRLKIQNAKLQQAEKLFTVTA